MCHPLCHKQSVTSQQRDYFLLLSCHYSVLQVLIRNPEWPQSKTKTRQSKMPQSLREDSLF